MNPLEYLHLQLRLEGKAVVNGNLLRQVEVVPDEEIPLMVVAQLANGQVVKYYDESLKLELQVPLTKRFQDVKFPKLDPLFEFLKTQNISFEVGHYKTYVFSDAVANLRSEDVKCFSRENPVIQAFGFGDFAEHVYGIERGGKVVSACVSTRENSHCGEAWVYTETEYRKQGFAQQVVMEWARNMFRAHKVPFYSHKMENAASAKLARRLELQPVFEELVISYAADESS